MKEMEGQTDTESKGASCTASNNEPTSNRVKDMEVQLKTLNEMVDHMERYTQKMDAKETADDRLRHNMELMDIIADVLFIDNPAQMNTHQQICVYHAARVAILGLGVAWEDKPSDTKTDK